MSINTTLPDEAADERRRRVRRSATVLVLVALAFYVGFIAMAVVKALH
jgi:hypothetical protein